MRKRIKMKILSWVVKHLFKGLTINDIYIVKGGRLYENGELVNEKVAQKYKDEAVRLKYSDMWQMLSKKVAYHAERNMFDKSQTIDDMFFGKAMIYNINLINEYINKFEQIK